MAWVLVGVVLLVAGLGLVQRLPAPFNLGMGVTAMALGAWAAWVGAQGLLGMSSNGCREQVLHAAPATAQAPAWSVLRELCPGQSPRHRVEVTPSGSPWPWPRVVFRARGLPEPRGVTFSGPRTLAVMVDGDGPNQARALPVELQGLFWTPDRVWMFQDGRATHE